MTSGKPVRPSTTELEIEELFWNCCPICAQAQNRKVHTHYAGGEANTHAPVIATDYMYVDDTTDDTNNPILAIHGSCKEGLWAVFAKTTGDRTAHT